MGKEKLYELIFDEKNIGVFGVSIVESPAVKHLAVKLSDECKCEFGDEMTEDLKLRLDFLIELGEKIEDLPDYEIIHTEAVNSDEFSFAENIESNWLEDSEQDNDLFKIRYRLAPNRLSVNSREFCRTLINADKIYRKEDIEIASSAGVNGQFSAKGQSTYDIFLYKGGVYCQHFWERVILFKKENDKKISSKEARRILNGLEPSERKYYRIKQNNPKVAQVAEAKNNYWKMADEEKRILTQPILIPNQKIWRNGLDGYVFLSAETIEKLQQNFFKNQYNLNSTEGHDENRVLNSVFIFESWIVENPENDKSKELGFDLPKGSWVVSMKIEDDELWSEIKKGVYNGLSIDAILTPIEA